MERTALLLRDRLFPAGREFDRVIADINQQGDLVSGAKSSELKSRSQGLRQQFSSQGQTDALVIESFALGREVIFRELNMRLSDEQLMAAWVMFKGNLAEMAGGEGKTLAVLLPACAAAFRSRRGTPCNGGLPSGSPRRASNGTTWAAPPGMMA
jgi:preprotein translocase subunit SecA